MKSLFPGKGRRITAWLSAVMLSAMMVVSQSALAVGGDILILSSTVSGSPSVEETNAVALGYSVDVVTPAQWAAMTTADFATYKAVVLGDPTCQTGTAAVAAAEANTAVWGAAVTGNVFIIGSDPRYHYYSRPGAQNVYAKGIDFAASDPLKTGAFITLSCYYHWSPALTPVPVLDAFAPSGFSVIGGSKITGLNNVHIVATHPSLVGLTDADLSNWGNSVHEGFDSWPIGFEVLAMAVDASTATYTAPDGTVGAPYILARGVQVISNIDLSPDTATNPLGTDHTVTATVLEDEAPVVGTTVTFEVVDGPSVSLIGTAVTDGSGQATFTWSSLVAGVDTIEARYTTSAGVPQRSDRVTKEWIGLPPVACNAGANGSVNEAAAYTLDGSASSGGVAPLSFYWTGSELMDDEFSATPTFMAPVVSGNLDTTWALTVTDAAGQSESCSVVVTVIDSDLPPDCSSASATVGQLWPPNHKLVEVGVAGVVDAEDPTTNLVITSVTQDEPTNGLGDGDMSPDAAVDGEMVTLRAERSGLEDGRVYAINFTATDALGQSCSGTVTTGVPHNKKSTPVDSGQAFDSTVE